MMNRMIEKFLQETGSALVFNSGEGEWEIIETWTLREHGYVLTRAKDFETLENEIGNLNKPSQVEQALRELVNTTTHHDHPVFSEDFLYEMIGKDDARTLLSRLSSVCKILGFDLHKLQGER